MAIAITAKSHAIGDLQERTYRVIPAQAGIQNSSLWVSGISLSRERLSGHL